MTAADAPASPVLYQGPLPLVPGHAARRRWFGLVMRFLALAVAGFYAVYADGEVAVLRADAALGADPAAVEAPAAFHGKVTTRLGLLPEYRGTVRFALPDGHEVEAPVHFSTLLAVDRATPQTVRYRPGQPQQALFSWAQASLGQRWAWQVLVGLIGIGLLGGCLWWLGTLGLRQAALARALAVDGQLVLAQLLRVQEVKNHGRVVSIHLRVAWNGPGGPQQANGGFKPKEGGAFLVDGDRVLIACSPTHRSQCLLLRHDLWPLQATPQLHAAVAQGILAASRSQP